MTIEIVDFPIEKGDVPYKSPFSHGFPWVFLLKMVDFPIVFPTFVAHPWFHVTFFFVAPGYRDLAREQQIWLSLGGG